MKSRKRAFTLVELLVVVGIIALLISILLPALSKARNQAVKVQCAAQLRQWGMALANYAGENKGTFPYNGTPKGTWCPIGGKDVSWTSTIVLQFVSDYLIKNRSLTDLGKNNMMFCPLQIYHRDATVAYDPTLQDGLLGYFYMPHRNSKSGENILNYAPPTNVDGVGWVEKKKFAQTYKFAPIMSDMLQYDVSRGWNYYSSHVGKAATPEGGNFLFEDGHVKWYRFDQIDVGAEGGGWKCNYKVSYNW